MKKKSEIIGSVKGKVLKEHKKIIDGEEIRVIDEMEVESMGLPYSHRKYEVIDSIWWGPWIPIKLKLVATVVGINTVSVGAIVVKTKKGLKCYIGVTGGEDQKTAEQWVAMHGAKVIPRIAEAMFPGKKFIM
jgi:hypothetical protein